MYTGQFVLNSFSVKTDFPAFLSCFKLKVKANQDSCFSSSLKTVEGTKLCILLFFDFLRKICLLESSVIGSFISYEDKGTIYLCVWAEKNHSSHFNDVSLQ